MIQGEAFSVALEEFCAADEPDRWQLLATYRSAGLRKMLVSVYDTLRSAALPLVLTPAVRESLDDAILELRSESDALLLDAKATELQKAGRRRRARPAPDDAVAGAADRAARCHRARPTGRCVQRRAHESAGARARGARLARPRAAAGAPHRVRRAYAAAKDRESALDFEDLQLRAWQLLRDNEQIRELEQLRFRSIMVDEFQDTNRLQTELIDLVCAGPAKEMFFVGDEFQSIYGFRHADVAVFRDRREAAPQVLPLTLNYRSRPEVLAAVNELFAGEFGDDFQPLEPAERLRRPAVRHTGRAARHRQADLRRLRASLAARGGAARGSPRARARRGGRRDARRDRAALRRGNRRGVVRGGAPGRRPADDPDDGRVATSASSRSSTCSRTCGSSRIATTTRRSLTVLASPFVGVSNDALVLIRATAERRPIFKGIERTLPADLPEDDRRLVRAFLQRYERLVESSARLSLELLCERILVEHDYDLAVLTRRDGQRRYANLRKLARLARSYEELRGPDLEGFIRFVAEQDAAGAPRARRRLRGGGSRRRATAHDPRRQGARVQGRRRRGRRARSERATTRSSASRTVASASRSLIRIPGRGSSRARTRTSRRRGIARRRPSGSASTTWR